jgi:hypothetical protein
LGFNFADTARLSAGTGLGHGGGLKLADAVLATAASQKDTGEQNQIFHVFAFSLKPSK